MAGSIVFRIAYGLDIEPENDPLINLGERAVEGFIEAAAPGKWLVVRIPPRGLVGGKV